MGLGEALDLFPDTSIQWLEQIQAALFSFHQPTDVRTPGSAVAHKRIQVGDDLTLRFAEANDVDNLIELNAEMFNERQGQWTRELVSGQHPCVQLNDCTLIESATTGQIVSSMLWIPQTWSYGGVPFSVGMPEFVVTRPDYQRQGLIRKQFDVCHANSAVRGELMQAISGIR